MNKNKYFFQKLHLFDNHFSLGISKLCDIYSDKLPQPQKFGKQVTKTKLS